MPESAQLNFKTKVHTGTYIALGFGATMTDTEIVRWSVDSSISTANLQTYYATGHHKPTEKVAYLDCYKSSVMEDPEDSSYFNFVTTRYMDCSSVGSDGFLVQTDVQTPLIVAWNPESYQMSFHHSNRD